MKHRLTSHRFTMIECLTVMSVMLVVLATAGRIFYEATVANRQFSQEAWSNQRMLMLHDDWQTFVRGTAPDSWSVDGATFLAEERAVRVSGNQLSLELESRTVRRTLPDGAEISFGIDGDGAERFAVMTVAWVVRLRQRDTPQQVRLVAAPLEVQP